MTQQVASVSNPVECQRPTNVCKIAIVGEAPGADEVISGKPFTGASGKLLDELLIRAGINRPSCLVTNVFRFKPPQNNVQHFFIKKTFTKSVEGWEPKWPISENGYVKQEFEEELTRLYQEIKEANPNVIIVLGATALWALTGHTKIKLMRGVCLSAAPWTGLSCKVIASYHPAAVLRQYAFKPLLGSDLLKARLESAYPEARTVKRNLWLYPTLEDLDKFYDLYIPLAVESHTPVAFDIETSERLMQITCIGFAPSPEVVIVVPFVLSDHGSYWSTLSQELAAWDWCRKILEDPSITKLTQNGMYDITWLYTRYGIKTSGPIEDTMHLHHALEPELLKDLGTLSANYTSQSQAWKTMSPFKSNKDEE